MSKYVIVKGVIQPARVRCRWCAYRVRVLKDGTMATHSEDGDTCYGSRVLVSSDSTVAL